MDSLDRHPVTLRQGLAAKYAASGDDTTGRKPLYRSTLLWCGVALAVAFIALYAFTDALAWLPRAR